MMMQLICSLLGMLLLNQRALRPLRAPASAALVRLQRLQGWQHREGAVRPEQREWLDGPAAQDEPMMQVPCSLKQRLAAAACCWGSRSRQKLGMLARKSREIWADRPRACSSSDQDSQTSPNLRR
jgi:hypothetical protein